MSNVASITEAPVKKRAKSPKPSKEGREQALKSVTQTTETVSNVAPLRAVPPPQPRQQKSAIYSSELTIKFTGAPNPVREGTNRAVIWSLFKEGMTVGEFTTALSTTDKCGKNGKSLVGGHGDLQIAVGKGYIELV